MNEDKLYKILLKLYRDVYKHIGVDFDSLDKQEHFYLNYSIAEEDELRLVNKAIARLNEHDKNVIKINYYLGCSPKTIKS